MLIFPHEYKCDLEYFINYADLLKICSRSMNANHCDIMEQYCRPHITLDKFSPDESVVCYHKNCIYVGNNNNDAARSHEFEQIFEITAHVRSLAGLSNNSQADR